MIIEIFLGLFVQIILISGIAYYFDETRFQFPSLMIIFFRVSLVFMLLIVSLYQISLFFLTLRMLLK